MQSFTVQEQAQLLTLLPPTPTGLEFEIQKLTHITPLKYSKAKDLKDIYYPMDPKHQSSRFSLQVSLVQAL